MCPQASGKLHQSANLPSFQLRPSAATSFRSRPTVVILAIYPPIVRAKAAEEAKRYTHIELMPRRTSAVTPLLVTWHSYRERVPKLLQGGTPGTWWTPCSAKRRHPPKVSWKGLLGIPYPTRWSPLFDCGLVCRRVGSGAASYYHDATGSVTRLSDGASRMTDSYDAPRLSLSQGSPIARVRQHAIMLGSAESMRTGLAAVEVVET